MRSLTQARLLSEFSRGHLHGQSKAGRPPPPRQVCANPAPEALKALATPVALALPFLRGEERPYSVQGAAHFAQMVRSGARSCPVPGLRQ